MQVPFKFPIAVKLAVITVVLLLACMVPMAWKTSELFKAKSEEREKDVNRAEADSRASEVEVVLQNLVKRSRLTGIFLLQKKQTGDSSASDPLRLGFDNEDDFVSLHIYQNRNGAYQLIDSAHNAAYLQKIKKSSTDIAAFNQRNTAIFPRAFAGSLAFELTRIGRQPLISIGLPLAQNQGKISHIAVVNFSTNVLQKSFSRQGERTLYLVNREGKVLAHSDEKLALRAANLKKVPIVAKALASKVSKGQVTYRKKGGKSFIGSFSKIAFDLAVISEVSEEIILEPVRLVQRQVYFATAVVLSISIFVVFVFSLTLTRPIEKLVRLTRLISLGNFNITATKVVKSNDEVGTLAASFDAMVEGLKERDKVKSLFNKFHGSSVAESLLSTKSIGTGGTRRKVTVFFSDIRGFTAISEKSSPEQVVSMLNEYFARMVDVIHRSNGVVDKFIGDAIMAVWGAPHSTGNDAFHAINACLKMRLSLNELNKLRIARGEDPLMIGMGLHVGEAISGTIGSEERLEFTVIGDTVNMASRIEASTKAFGTDLLVSEDVVREVQDRFLVEAAGSAAVKGKSEPLKLFKITGYVDENKNKHLVKTPYSDYQAEGADKVKVV